MNACVPTPDPNHAPDEALITPPPSPLRRLLRALRGLWPPLVLGLVGWFGWRDLRGLDLGTLHQVVRSLRDSDLLVLQMLAMIPVLAMCGYDLLLNRWLGIGLPVSRVLRYAWPACTLANLVGLSGMTGSGIRYLALSRERVAGRTIAAYAGLQLLAIPLGLGLLSAAALVIALRQHVPLPLPGLLPQLLLAAFVAYVPGFFLATGSGMLHRRFLKELPPLTTPLRLQLTLASLGEWGLALAVLWVSLGLVDVPATPPQLVLAFALAATAGIASQVPGGLGVLDGTLLLILRGMGYPAEGVTVAKLSNRQGRMLPSYGYPDITLPHLPKAWDLKTPEKPLVLGMIRQESAFRGNAVSRSHAHGLMQLMPATAKLVARAHGLPYSRHRLLTDGHYNLTLGQSYLAGLMADFDGSYILSVAAYNAGPNRVRSWIRENGDPRQKDIDVIDWVEMIPFDETRNYVQRVMENLHVYRSRLDGTEMAFAPHADLTR